MKRIPYIACLLALLLLTALPVFAADRQTVTLSENADGKALTVTSEDGRAAAWEIPALKAGERLLESGTITLTNLTEEDARIALDYVELPFDNANALIYLNHLSITVREGDEVLYDGPYSRINDAGGLAFEYTLAPEQSVTLTVDLRRDYAPITVTGFERGTAIEWKFKSVRDIVIDPNPTTPSQTVTTTKKPTTTVAAEPETFDDPELQQVFLAVIAAAAVLGLVLVVQRTRRR